eukprot:15430771-Alexandrium_andersonii.AAC.1
MCIRDSVCGAQRVVRGAQRAVQCARARGMARGSVHGACCRGPRAVGACACAGACAGACAVRGA